MNRRCANYDPSSVGVSGGTGGNWNEFGLMQIPYFGSGSIRPEGIGAMCGGCQSGWEVFGNAMCCYDSFGGGSGGSSGKPSPSQNLLNFLANCEGHMNNYGLYNDSRGNCTVGIGQFLHSGPCTAADSANYPNGEDPSTAMNVFAEQVNNSANDISNNVSGSLNQGQFDALVSLDFNMGLSTLETHDVWGDVQAGNYDAVPADITSLGAGGPGIPARRANEAQMFQNGVYNPGGCYAQP
jgi:GH24 family phage-related lysozyme (muramidase)